MSNPLTSGQHQDDDDIFCFKNTDLCYKKIEELSEQSKDCTIVTQDKKFLVHRSIMSLVSSYFEASVRFDPMLENKENNEEEISDRMVVVRLDDMSEIAVRTLIAYAYTGEIYFTKYNEEDILKCADFLCVESVSQACCMYISEHLEYNEAFELVRNSESMCKEHFSMYRVLILFAAQNFSLFLQKKSYLEFDLDFLVEVLSHDKLVVMEELVYGDKTEFYFTTPARQEEIVLKCVIQYVQHVKDNSILPRLVKKCVRLGLISAEVLCKYKKMETISNCSECLELFRLVNGTCDDSRIDASKSFPSNWNKPRDLKDALVVSWSRATEIDGDNRDEDEDTNATFPIYKPVEDDSELEGVSSDKIRIFQDKKFILTHIKYDYFDDSELVTESCPLVFVTGVKAYDYQDCITGHTVGLLVKYSNGANVQHGPEYYRQFCPVSELNLQEDERIVKVFLYPESQATSEFYFCGFETNKGRQYPQKFSSDVFEISKPHPSACLAFVKGKTGCRLERKQLQFGWIYNKKLYSK